MSISIKESATAAGIGAGIGYFVARMAGNLVSPGLSIGMGAATVWGFVKGDLKSSTSEKMISIWFAVAAAAFVVSPFVGAPISFGAALTREASILIAFVFFSLITSSLLKNPPFTL